VTAERLGPATVATVVEARGFDLRSRRIEPTHSADARTKQERPRRGDARGVKAERWAISEAQIQRTIFSHLRQRGAAGAFFSHPFSGGFRRPKEAAIYKGLGAIAGLPDVMILHQGKLYCVELKVEDGRLSEAQEHVLIKLRDAGAIATHTHGLDQALRVLEGWGLLRGRSA